MGASRSRLQIGRRARAPSQAAGRPNGGDKAGTAAQRVRPAGGRVGWSTRERRLGRDPRTPRHTRRRQRPARHNRERASRSRTDGRNSPGIHCRGMERCPTLRRVVRRSTVRARSARVQRRRRWAGSSARAAASQRAARAGACAGSLPEAARAPPLPPHCRQHPDAGREDSVVRPHADAGQTWLLTMRSGPCPWQPSTRRRRRPVPR